VRHPPESNEIKRAKRRQLLTDSTEFSDALDRHLELKGAFPNVARCLVASSKKNKRLLVLFRANLVVDRLDLDLGEIGQVEPSHQRT
jgi:hypothetical protein